jgi:adenylylsulfate kinase
MEKPRTPEQRFPRAVRPLPERRIPREKPVTIWLTGLSGAGKSTIAFELERQLLSQGHPCCVLDGDKVRLGLSNDLGFDPADRRENVRRVAHVAQLMNDAGLIVITALISPMQADRAMAREIIGPGNFVETYLSAPLDTCARRDLKGLYSQALAGSIPSFTGISAPYEVPPNPELEIDTATLTPSESVAGLLAYLHENSLAPLA